ncbi:hypothetical protein BSPWISOX_2262 [uncultured Gammaproteobacteria bacterium]|nr:hypothetical protein BSPWISOX_2262 [uncultured Gammaproteobacteria bacterium]
MMCWKKGVSPHNCIKVSVAGCLGYDVLESKTHQTKEAEHMFQLLVV